MIEQNNIRKTIATRIQESRAKQSNLAKAIDATQAKLSMFLNSNETRDTTLRTEELNKLFDILGINTYLYYNRSEFAKEIAKKLRGKKVTKKDLDNWTKEQIAVFLNDNRITLFFDVDDEEQFKKLQESKLIDIESTFPFIKSLIQYHMLAGDEPTPSTSKRALLEIGKSIGDDVAYNSDEIINTVFGTSISLLPTSLFPTVFPIIAARTLFHKMLKNK